MNAAAPPLRNPAAGPPRRGRRWPGATRPVDTLRGFRRGYAIGVGAAALLQLAAFGGVEDNLPCVLLALAASLLGIQWSLDSARFRANPISALLLMFYTTTGPAGALLVKTIEWSPLAERLLVPVTTFSVLLAGQLVLMAADLVYRRFEPLQRARAALSRRVVRPLGLYAWPSDLQLWMLGAIGCVSVMLTGTDFESGASFGLATAGEKLIRAFGFLKFAPFLIAFRGALSDPPAAAPPPLAPLFGYFCLLVVVSFATNSRSTFADALPTIAICMLVAAAFGRLDLRHVPRGRLVAALLLAALAGLALSRISLAMVVVRDYRHTLDLGMLVRMTLAAMVDGEWLEAAQARMDTAVSIGGYSETYVDSKFFGRFLLTKFHDNMLYYFSLFGSDHMSDYCGFMLDRLLATLPDPVLRALGLSIEKQDLVVSNADYVVYIIDGWGLGGFKTGSVIGEIYSTCGWAWPLVLAGAALLLFVVYDAFVQVGPGQRVVVSPLIALLIWNLCGTTAAFGLGTETITAIPAGIVRNLPQHILFYLVALLVTRAAARLVSTRRPAPAAPLSQ